jgi:hypothetical protein
VALLPTCHLALLPAVNGAETPRAVHHLSPDQTTIITLRLRFLFLLRVLLRLGWVSVRGSDSGHVAAVRHHVAAVHHQPGTPVVLVPGDLQVEIDSISVEQKRPTIKRPTTEQKRPGDLQVEIEAVQELNLCLVKVCKRDTPDDCPALVLKVYIVKKLRRKHQR